MKQTPVQWLVDYIKHLEIYPYKTLKELEVQAKEMEKQQIVDAYMNGDGDAYHLDQVKEEAEQYYNETFKNS